MVQSHYVLTNLECQDRIGFSIPFPLFGALPECGSLSDQISMGQGQADVALAKLRECSRNGEWLCLKNLHLVTAWLPQF